MMDDSTRSLCRERFREKKSHELIPLLQQILHKEPSDIYSRYCLALAYQQQQEYVKLFAGLTHILRYYQESPAVEQSETIRHFVGQASVQLLTFSVFYNYGPYKQVAALSYAVAKKILEHIMSKTHDAVLMEDYNRLSRYAYPCASMKAPPLRLDSPFMLQVEPTNFCNISCAMCNHHKIKRPKGNMERGTWDRMMQAWGSKYAQLSVKHLMFEDVSLDDVRFGHIKLFFMGEPLLHPQLDYFVADARRHHCIVGVQTNGMLLHDQTVRRRLLDAGPSHVFISIDGTSAAAYETIRKKASWAVVCEGLKALAEERRQRGLEKTMPIWISSIVTGMTEENLRAVRSFLEPVRDCFDQIGFIPLNRQDTPDFIDSTGALATFEKVHAEAVPLQPLCLEPLEKLNILWDGMITPCCYDIDGAMSVGHVQDGVDAVWNNERTRRLQEALLCQKIDAYPVCRACKGWD